VISHIHFIYNKILIFYYLYNEIYYIFLYIGKLMTRPEHILPADTVNEKALIF